MEINAIIQDIIFKGFAGGLVGGLTVWMTSYGLGKVIKVFRVVTS